MRVTEGPASDHQRVVGAQDRDDITPEWMSAALAAGQPGATVQTVTVEVRDDGTNRRARLGLTYRAGNGPATVFVKAAYPAHKELIRMTSGMFHEPRLFTCGAQLPLEHPTIYTALIDEANYDFVMVMEDLTARGADPREATRPMTVEQVATGVRGLARMHGQYWGERVLRDPALGWLEPFLPWNGHGDGAAVCCARTPRRRRSRRGHVIDYRHAHRADLEALHQNADHISADPAAW